MQLQQQNSNQSAYAFERAFGIIFGQPKEPEHKYKENGEVEWTSLDASVERCCQED